MDDHILLCSNRDEIIERSTCELVDENSKIYPKEPLQGGSWICTFEHGAIVLLNGAFEKHKRFPPYSKSRGVLLLEISEEKHPIQVLKSMDLTQIEPFTIVVFQGGEIFEFIWTGAKKHFTEIDPKLTKIWSSSTLYDQSAKSIREQRFKELTNNNIDADSLWRFHTKPSSDLINGIYMNRIKGPRTISTTMLILSENKTQFKYYDHIQEHLQQINH